MVNLVVYFESLHRAAAAATAANAAAASAATAPATAASAAASDEVLLAELRLRYEQGLDLLLNAADLEAPCTAIFCEYERCGVEELKLVLGESLMKKLKQLDLYEIPTYVLVGGGDEGNAEASSAECASAAIFDFAKIVVMDEDSEVPGVEEAKTFSF